jgi:heme/copper-type cytochrome/quinol oxidase subunit 4
MKKILTTISVSVSSVAFVFAQVVATTNNQVGGSLISLLNTAQTIVLRLVPLGIGLAVVALFYGIIMFMWKGREKADEHDKWLKWMGMCIIAIFVMVSIWGLVGFISSVFGIGVGGDVPTPNIPLPK